MKIAQIHLQILQVIDLKIERILFESYIFFCHSLL